MDSTFDMICDCLVEKHSWKQCISIVDSKKNVIDLSPACGVKHQTPANATDQPKLYLYPQGSHYLFPKELTEIESEENLFDILTSQTTCPGLQLMKQSSNTGRSGQQLAEYSLYCNNYQHVAKLKTVKEFKDGKWDKRTLSSPA